MNHNDRIHTAYYSQNELINRKVIRRLIDQSSITKGDLVYDIGAGSGYFTIRIAKAVGPTGMVWACDVEQEMLDHIDRRVQEENLKNLRQKWVPEDDPQLPAGGVDSILIIHTFPYIQNRSEYAQKLRKALAPGGRVVIIEYASAPGSFLP